MIHPMLEENFSFSSYDMIKAIQRIAKVAHLREADRSHANWGEGGPSAYQSAFRTLYGWEVFVFDLAGMSLEKTAERFLRWSGLPHNGHLIYVAPTFSRSFISDLQDTQGAAPVSFIRIVENSDGFEMFDEAMAAPDQPEDDDLDRLLMNQRRPSIPRELRDARDQFEALLVPALMQDMSPPEARVQATILRTQFENVAAARGAREARDQLKSQILRGGLGEAFTDDEVARILNMLRESPT